MKCFRDTNQRDVLTGAFPYTAEGPRLCFYGHCIGDCGDCGNRCGLHGARLSQFLVGCCAHTVAAGPQGGASRGRRTTRGRRWAPTRTASACPSATSGSARPARAARARGSRSFDKSAAQASMSPSTFRTRTPRTAAATGARSTRSCRPWTSRSPRTTSTSATATAIRAGCAPPPAAPCAATQCCRVQLGSHCEFEMIPSIPWLYMLAGLAFTTLMALKVVGAKAFLDFGSSERVFKDELIDREGNPAPLKM